MQGTQQATVGMRGQDAESGELASHKPFSDYEFTFDLVTAIGTLIVALLAIFGDRVRAFLSRPKLLVETSVNGPHVELVKESVAMQSEQVVAVESLRVRLCVRNVGRSIARSSRLVVDKIYRTRDRDPGLHVENLLPRVMPWPDDDKPIDLVPNFPYFVDVARVKQDEGEGDVPNGNPGRDQPTAGFALHLTFLKNLLVSSQGELLKIGAGRVVFPLTIFSENTRRPSVYFISIYWSGSDPKSYKDKDKFDIQVLTSTEAKKKFPELR